MANGMIFEINLQSTSSTSLQILDENTFHPRDWKQLPPELQKSIVSLIVIM